MRYSDPLGRGWLRDAIEASLSATDAKYNEQFNRLEGVATPKQAEKLSKIVQTGHRLTKLRNLLTRRP